MEPLMLIFILVFGVFAGGFGSMLGLGGGVFMMPFFILVLNIPAHQAVALSLLGVIASSNLAGSIYIRDRISNLKLAMVLETCTVTGGVLGVFIALAMPVNFVKILLGLVLIYASFMMIKGSRSEEILVQREGRLALSGEYYDDVEGRAVKYSAIRVKVGLFASMFAGAISGIVGVGGGVILMPIMKLVMKVPMKACAATNNFMVGVTAAASTIIYFNNGVVDLYMAIPTVLGIMIGAYVGTRLMVRTESALLRGLLGIVLSFSGILLLLSAGGILVW